MLLDDNEEKMTSISQSYSALIVRHWPFLSFSLDKQCILNSSCFSFWYCGLFANLCHYSFQCWWWPPNNVQQRRCNNITRGTKIWLLHLLSSMFYRLFLFRQKVFMSFYTTVSLNINWDGRKEVSQKWKLLDS